MSALRSLDRVRPSPRDEDSIFYPEGDGKPMAETEIHVNQILYLYSALQFFFASAPSIYVGANMLLYYVRGNPRRSVAPDIFVTRGVAKYVRRTYKVWEEGK